jgi:hypothetical protein
MVRDTRAYLWDVQQGCARIARFLLGVDFDAYTANDLVRSAVERQFEIIGEALSQLSKVDSDLDWLVDTSELVARSNANSARCSSRPSTSASAIRRAGTSLFPTEWKRMTSLNPHRRRACPELLRERVGRGSSYIEGPKVNVLGLTFKEDCGDLCNSKAGFDVAALEGAGLAVWRL